MCTLLCHPCYILLHQCHYLLSLVTITGMKSIPSNTITIKWYTYTSITFTQCHVPAAKPYGNLVTFEKSPDTKPSVNPCCKDNGMNRSWRQSPCRRITEDKSWKQYTHAMAPSMWYILSLVSCQGPYSQSGKTSYHQISWSIEVARLDVVMVVVLWYLTCSRAAPLPRCLIIIEC